jgi:hypothetical protein
MLRRRRKVLEEGYNCVLCHLGTEETIEHLFFDCPSAISRWFAIGIVWEDNLSIHQKLYQARHVFGQPFFMEIFMISAWCLWKQKMMFFERKVPCLATWKVAFKSQVMDHLVRIKPSITSLSNFGFKHCNFWLFVFSLPLC